MTPAKSAIIPLIGYNYSLHHTPLQRLFKLTYRRRSWTQLSTNDLMTPGNRAIIPVSVYSLGKTARGKWTHYCLNKF